MTDFIRDDIILFFFQDVNRRLDSLDAQFTLQAKELELMRERLRQAEVEKEIAQTKSRHYEDTARRKKSPHRSPRLPTRPPDDIKLRQLETEQSKLRASHATTEVSGEPQWLID